MQGSPKRASSSDSHGALSDQLTYKNPLDDVGDTQAAADGAAQSSDGGFNSAAVVVLVQTFVTFLFAPVAFLWIVTVLTDIAIYRVGTCDPDDDTCHKWPLGGLHFWVLIVFPALSFWGSCYMLVQYWMDEKSWTLLRKRVMFANVPMCIFFALVLMGQSEYHTLGMNCPQMGAILNATYLMMNLWHTMTIITAYRFICLEKGRLIGAARVWVHIVCWGFPIISTVLLSVLYDALSTKTHIEPSVYHENIFTDPDIRGIGWCGVKSTNRVLKAVFVNSPQLIAVSLYAQYYSYIHDHIDPDPDADPSKVTARVSTSSNAALMGAAELRKVTYNQDLARQLRLYMTAYMMSFLTNTVMQVVGDNLAIGAPSDANLLIQAVVVTPQGFLWAIVYMKSSPNSLFAAYCNLAIKFFEARGKLNMAARIKRLRDRGKKLESMSSTASPGTLTKIKDRVVLFLQSFLMIPVAIWVWTPMEFLAEQLTSRAWIFIGLCIWGTATVFPVYWFAVGSTVSSPLFYSVAAQAYVVLVIVISAWAVWNNRYAHYLCIIEGPVRRVGVFSSIGQGYRLNSMRNIMGMLTLSIEFYQVWGLAWGTAKMNDQYEEPTDGSDVGLDGSFGPDESDIRARLQELARFWGVVGAVGGWAVLYSLPACITTTSVGNQQLAFNLMEKYRKYLWFMSGAGFLTILKALMKVIFCLPDPHGNLGADGEVRQVVLTDYNLECWSQHHLRMTAIALISLILFFPSASLTCLFRYGNEDDRQLPCCKPTAACCDCNSMRTEGVNNVGGIVLGGEDTRWIHIWKRAEYMVKGVWVFTAYKFSTYGIRTPAIVFLLGGSFCIAWMNFFMSPSNLSYVGRSKFNVHVCNVWTTMTCLWAILTDNKNKTKHFIFLFAGWVTLWIMIWGYEIYKFKTDVFRQPVGLPGNIFKCKKEIDRLKEQILGAKSLAKWGVHAKVVRLLRFAEHEDLPVRHAAYEALAVLSYMDQMSRDRSCFLFLTPTDPAVPIFIKTIESETDPDVRNLATQTLVVMLQMNVMNTYGLPATFYQKVQDYDEERGHVLVPEFVRYINDCENRSHQIDALLLLNQLCTVDSNHLIEVVDVGLPLLRERLTNGVVIEQYAACQLVVKIANRPDLAGHLISTGIMAALSPLFHVVMDHYKKDGLIKAGGGEAFARGVDGKVKPITSSLIVPGHNLPARLRELYKIDNLSDGIDLNVDLHSTVAKDATIGGGEPVFRHLMFHMLHDMLETLVEVAAASGAAYRRWLIDEPHTALTWVKRGFELPGGTSDGFGMAVKEDLQLEGLRAMSAFLKGALFAEERDIDVDPDFRLFNNMINRFKQEKDNTAEGDDNVNENGEHVLLFDKTLTPLQRRKAHMMCEYNGCLHESIGTGFNRQVKCTYVNDKIQVIRMSNPLDRAASSDAPEPVKSMDFTMDLKVDANMSTPGYLDKDDETNFAWNWDSCKQMEMPRRLLALKETVTDSAGPVMFYIMDILLLLLEHRMISDSEQYETVSAIMIDAVSHDNVGIAVMGATGAEHLVIDNGTFAALGLRKKKYGGGKKLFRWAGRMVFWIQFWRIHSGSLGFLTPEEELAAKEEAEEATK